MSEVLYRDRRRFLAAAAMTFAAAPIALLGWPGRLSIEGEFPTLAGATTWLGSRPLTKSDLRGRVVLVGFWTYSCINWRRSLPYVRAWAERYKDHGLVVIGVHSPEFGFEHDIDNVRRAIREMGIEYPIAIDNDFAIWRAFENQFWPALYFIDEKGRIRHHKFGEGDYDQSEMVLQQLLEETGAHGFGSGVAPVKAAGPELAADWFNLKSGENYLGYERTENFASPGGLAANKPHIYKYPADLRLNHWALTGEWLAAKQAIRAYAANARITYHFHARDLHLVMGSASNGTPLRFRILIDGREPREASGTDVDEAGRGLVTEPRMYHLIRQSGPIVDRQLEIEFLDPGADAYSVTFG